MSIKEKEQVLFKEIICSKTKHIWYQRYDLAADGQWVLTRGVKTKNDGGIGYGASERSNTDVANARLGPLYKCPYCGNSRYVKCGTCGRLSCWPDNKDDFYCSYPDCSGHGKITGKIKDLGEVDVGKGQG